MEQNRTKINKERMLKALEASLGVTTTALKKAELSRTNYYKWLKEDEEFAAKVAEIENIQKDFVKSKFLEAVSDKVPSVLIHATKHVLGWSETKKLDITSGEEPVKININIEGIEY